MQKKNVLKKEKPVKNDHGYILKDVLGNDVNEKDYFFSDGIDTYSKKDQTGKVLETIKKETLVPPYFNESYGLPVDREDLLEVFNKIFRPEDGFLFYKTVDKEVYVVIIPLKYSEVGPDAGSMSGDFQKHAISFIAEGSANPETLKMKLKRVAQSVKYSEK